MLTLPPEPLVGQLVTLELLNESHHDELQKIANDPAIWTYMVTSAFSDNFDHWYNKAIHEQKIGSQRVYVVRNQANKQLVGSSRFYFIDPQNQRLNIGYTWFHPSVWGKNLNLETKYLMLTFAFETMHCNRVELMTDSRNQRSQTAIKKIGAIQEGILRKHLVLKDGHVRDSIVFSIISDEWAQTKENLASLIVKNTLNHADRNSSK